MYCPRCGAEYHEGIESCADCRVALVEKRPTPAHDEAEWVDLITVLTTDEESQLKVVRSLLEAEGIPCYVQGEVAEETLPVGRLGVQVQVRPQDAESARELLAAKDLLFTGPDEPVEDDEA
ncbi:MAG: DUF2007 domain-containing protein [Candidatus Eisenbacteria bacterium]|nr:DUF2007 domain-containing protein [Candidatus Eisenbacteria bacterium]